MYDDGVGVALIRAPIALKVGECEAIAQRTEHGTHCLSNTLSKLPLYSSPVVDIVVRMAVLHDADVTVLVLLVKRDASVLLKANLLT